MAPFLLSIEELSAGRSAVSYLASLDSLRSKSGFNLFQRKQIEQISHNQPRSHRVSTLGEHL